MSKFKLKVVLEVSRKGARHSHHKRRDSPLVDLISVIDLNFLG